MAEIAKKPSGRNVYLDLFKFLLAYMVICIHLTGEMYSIFPLYRLAVYFFFSAYMYIIQPHTDIPIRYMRNAWFFGLPTFGLGYLVAQIDWHKKAWYKYLYLGLALLFFFLQIGEHALIARENHNIEMYVSGVLAAVFFLQFFLGIEKADCKFYYEWIGKSAPFGVYILHMGVAVVLANFVSFANLYVKCLVVLLISFAIYEIVFLLSKWIKWLKKKRQATAVQNTEASV